MFSSWKHTGRWKTWQKTGLTTLRRQRYFRFTRGASYHHSVNSEHIKMQNGAMAHLKTACGPPAGNHWSRLFSSKIKGQGQIYYCVDLCLGPQDPRRPPGNCGTHRVNYQQGRSQTFSFGGPLEGPVLQQGELSMVCVGLSERDLKNFWGDTGGPGKIFGRQWPPWHPLAPPLITGIWSAL